MQPASDVATGVEGEGVWRVVRALAQRARAGSPLQQPTGVALQSQGLRWCDPRSAPLELRPNGSYLARAPISADAALILDLCLPLCVGPGASDLVVAHLGQSLDGRICTRTGDSQFITGQDDLVHTHRLRALFDAVLVGAQTVESDDPQLTTRHVSGNDPVRVVLDPRGRVAPTRGVLTDGKARTLLLRRPGVQAPHGKAELIETGCRPDGEFDLTGVLDILRARGLRRVFIEGGGITVSRFLQAGLLDRLHLAIAPVVIGSGTSALQRPPIDALSDALRMSARTFPLGTDVLFDCDLSP